MNRTTINVGGRRISVERSRIRMGENVLSVAEPRQATGRGRFGVVSKERRTVDGVVFDSGKEAKRFAELRTLERAGLITDLECQVAFPVEIGGKPFCKFTVDFTYREAGAFVAEELKSSGTQKDAAYRLRRKAAELAYGLKVREVVR